MKAETLRKRLENRKMALTNRTGYVTIGDVDLECEYYIERDDNWGRNDVVVEKIIYENTDVTELIREIDVEFFNVLSEKIKDAYEI